MEKLDIHNTTEGLKRALDCLASSDISDKQKKKLQRLVLELQIGKASKKKVGNHRLISYVYNWIKLHHYFKKDFEDITEQEGEKFYQDLDKDRIKRDDGKPYKPNTKQEMIKSLKRYLKWCLPEIEYRKKVGWIKEYHDIPDMKAISLKEAESIIKAIPGTRDQAVFMFLFDSGARIEEALNLKIVDIQKKEKEKSDGEFYLADIKFSKTKPRKISIPLTEKYITDWLKEHPDNKNPEAYLFPIGYDAVRKMIKTYSNRVLGFKVTPHQLRHSSATLYCKKIDNPYKFCYRYGWKFGSKEANRYIDRNLLGEEEQEKLKNIIENDKVEVLERNIKTLQEQASQKDMEMRKLQEQIDKLAKVHRLATLIRQKE